MFDFALRVLFLVPLTVLPTQGFTTTDETKLRGDIFTGYDYEVRPEDVTHVLLDFSPTSLSKIDIKSGTMEISGWWTLNWNDTRLTWNPASYDNIEETHVFQHEVWTPTIIVYNSVDNLSALNEHTIPLRISPTGHIVWSPPGILKVSCSTDITYFPFDTQTCAIQVTTFGYSISQLQINEGQVDMTFYTPNGEWILERVYTETEHAAYSYLNYQFVFKRKPSYYGLNLLLPVIMCWLLSVFIFLLPAESGEKMGYSLTVLLAFVVLMTLLADTMPTTADHVSLLEVYIILVLSFCGLSVGYSIISLALYFHQEDVPVPLWLTRFTLWVNRRALRSQPNKVGAEAGGDQGLQVQDLDKVPPTKGKWSEAQSPPGAEGGEVGEMTWKKAALAMDSVVFKAYFVVTTLFTIIFLGVMGSFY
ncbi:neuronal acetylcholine receptor subunit alpha-7-like [Babylonia areolata]|uniref:neuronal acetylcholine receptor subunit alpha-7-like n=1 Tax=Babylonia areolata TaxID=304850 RepID=UPI003FD3361F